MSTTDRAFFAAYTREDVVAVAAANRASQHLQGKPASAGGNGVNDHGSPSVDSGGPRYRLDSRHHERPGQPHRPPAPATPPATPPATTFPVQSVDIGCFVTNLDWLSSSMVMPPPVLEPPAAPPRNSTPPSVPAAPISKPAAEAPAPVEKNTAATVAEPAVEAGSPADTDDWKPVWEIDEFAWPEEAQHICGLQTDYFRYAGEKLRDASREGLKVLLVTATREHEGGSTLACCLARSVAAAGATVALFDANLHHPDLAAKLGLDFDCGWQDAIDHPHLLKETAVVALEDDITLFPLAHHHGIDSLQDGRIGRILAQLRKQFDLVIVDGGPLPPQDAAFFDLDNSPINAAMIVRDVRCTTEDETVHTAARLKSLGVDAIGIAENFTNVTTRQSAAA